MMQINLRATHSPDNNSRPSTMASVQNGGEYRPSARSLSVSRSFSRPYSGDYPGHSSYSSSTLNIDSPQDMSYGSLPPFARNAYADSGPNTRSSSPYPTPQTPFGFVSSPFCYLDASCILQEGTVSATYIAGMHLDVANDFYSVARTLSAGRLCPTTRRPSSNGTGYGRARSPKYTLETTKNS